MFTIGFDIRMTPTVDIVAFENQLRKWMAEAGGEIDLFIEHKFDNQKMTSVSLDDPWFQVSISPTFCKWLFHLKVFCTAFMCLQFGVVT